jgi:hypothetical protein
MKLISAFARFILVALFTIGFAVWHSRCIDADLEYRYNLMQAAQKYESE